MDIDTLRELIELLNSEKLTEITVADGNERITVKRDPAAAPYGIPATAGFPERAAIDEGSFELPAPLVGTFYRRQVPDGPPLVEIGDRVQAGATLCIIEAMKVMNEITAERPGILRAVLVQDGDPVEFGQPLFRFEAAGESASGSSATARQDAAKTPPASAL
ncbi:acetyl-CoA carboxylase biotin carboxyl carrier protein [Candidatus Bipolaricaulota bacterium]|nr:acetyl-CoA carboxylase biotin carboxyl carrier protein [Candidatus Bipolaricaulota bacterium]